MLKTPEEYNRDMTKAKVKYVSLQLHASLISVSAANQIALVDESGMIRTQMGTHNISENCRSVWDALYDTTI
jgi:hypothetical protein